MTGNLGRRYVISTGVDGSRPTQQPFAPEAMHKEGEGRVRHLSPNVQLRERVIAEPRAVTPMIKRTVQVTSKDSGYSHMVFINHEQFNP